MNAEFIASMEYWEREKGLDREILISAVEDAMVSAAKRAVGPARELRCEIDRKDGDIRAFASLIVVETVTDKQSEISIESAKRHKPDVQLDEELEVEVTPKNFGRIASQNAKQALMQAIRRAEKALVYSEFKDRVGDIVSGEVRGFDRSDVLIDLGKFEALLPNRERVPTEEYQRSERIRCLVKAVQGSDSHSEIILSRRDTDFVLKLFQLEVSEINDGTIEVKGIAREPGFRTKLAVHSRDEKVDPVGACVGLRGQRVKNIVRELNNEKIDIIRWDTDIETYVTNSLAPAQLKRLEITAPVAGVVYGMTVFAPRSVIRAADPVLYLVPQDRPLVIAAQIEPIHIDQTHVGQEVTLRFSALDQRTTPELFGTVTQISADAFTNEETSASYYRAEIILNEGEAEKLPEGSTLIPGMPVEAFLRTADRTPLAYLVKPFTDYFSKAFRES